MATTSLRLAVFSGAVQVASACYEGPFFSTYENEGLHNNFLGNEWTKKCCDRYCSDKYVIQSSWDNVRDAPRWYSTLHGQPSDTQTTHWFKFFTVTYGRWWYGDSGTDGWFGGSDGYDIQEEGWHKGIAKSDTTTDRGSGTDAFIRWIAGGYCTDKDTYGVPRFCTAQRNMVERRYGKESGVYTSWYRVCRSFCSSCACSKGLGTSERQSTSTKSNEDLIIAQKKIEELQHALNLANEDIQRRNEILQPGV